MRLLFILGILSLNIELAQDRALNERAIIEKINGKDLNIDNSFRRQSTVGLFVFHALLPARLLWQ